MITDRALIRILPAIPKPLVQFAAAPYVAGTSIADATDACDGLATTGRTATLDFLGEEVRNHHEIEAIRDTYVHLISAIREHQPDATVSVKPSALGLRRSYATCVGYLRDILDCGVFVRLDMEDATLTDRTLRLYTHLRQTGHDNLGLALQAYLRRTIDDVKAIARYQPNVRLCKGIYIEAAEIAFKDPDAIRQNYLRILNELASIEGTHIAIATHDEHLIRAAEANLPPSYEFEMLLGVRDRRGKQLATQGHPVRVYVPFGQDWYAYSIRRLQENPAMARTVAKATIARALRRHG